MVRAWSRPVVALVLLAGLGCTVDEADVRSYSRRSNGRAKLFAVLTDPQYALELRSVAAQELIGINALTDLEEGLKTMPEGDRPGVVEAVVAAQKKELSGANQQKQIRAKDVLYLVLPYLSGGAKEEVENLLIRWTTEKFSLRFRFGKFGTEKILDRIGEKAVPHVLALLRAGKDTVHVARILKGLDNPEAVASAADALIESLETKVMENSEPKILALGELGGAKSLAYLNTLAANNKTAGAWDRLKAMDELLKLSDKSSQETAVSIVSDRDAQFDLRRKALDLLGRVGDRDALPALFVAVGDADLRGPAWELTLRFGGADALRRLLTKEVKADWKMDKAGIDTLVRAMAKLGPSAEPALVAGLKVRKNLPARLISIRGLAQQGTRDAISALQDLMDDDTTLGEMGTSSVGIEATTAINKISRR